MGGLMSLKILQALSKVLCQRISWYVFWYVFAINAWHADFWLTLTKIAHTLLHNQYTGAFVNPLFLSFFYVFASSIHLIDSYSIIILFHPAEVSRRLISPRSIMGWWNPTQAISGTRYWSRAAIGEEEMAGDVQCVWPRREGRYAVVGRPRCVN